MPEAPGGREKEDRIAKKILEVEDWDGSERMAKDVAPRIADEVGCTAEQVMQVFRRIDVGGDADSELVTTAMRIANARGLTDLEAGLAIGISEELVNKMRQSPHSLRLTRDEMERLHDWIVDAANTDRSDQARSIAEEYVTGWGAACPEWPAIVEVRFGWSRIWTWGSPSPHQIPLAVRLRHAALRGLRRLCGYRPGKHGFG